MACRTRLGFPGGYIGVFGVNSTLCNEWCDLASGLDITNLDVCSVNWNAPVPWRMIAGDYDGAIMDQWAGYLIVLGFGVFFSIVTTIMVKLEQVFGGLVISSEHFNTAGRNIKTGLTASVIVSQWTWAATLLQSSNVASLYGLSGPFWYASGATVQILLFGILAIEIKKKAPNMHTFLEMIDVRWGKAAHLTFLFFGICTNLIVTGMLLQGGAATINALSGVHIVAGNFLIPVGVILYTWFGGLKATFLAAYVHTSVIMICLVIFMFFVYIVPGGTECHPMPLRKDDCDAACLADHKTQCNSLGSAALLWERLTFMGALPKKTEDFPFPTQTMINGEIVTLEGDQAYEAADYRQGGVPNNRGGSYLTMLSSGGLQFGVVNTVGNFGTVFVDQSYWQSAIAARPSSAHKGYLLGGLVWFTIPFSLATALGLASISLNSQMPPSEAGAGLAPPVAAVVLLGQGGGFLMTIMLFMAITSTGSAECIAVASLMAYDIYRKYFNPDCTGSQLLKVSRVVVVIYGVVCGLFGYFLYGVGLNLGWVYSFMGTVIGSAVIPVSCCLCTSYMTRNGAIAGAWVGQAMGIAAWLIVGSTVCSNGAMESDFTATSEFPSCETGVLNVTTLGNITAQTAGSTAALLGSGLVAYIIATVEYTMGKEKPFDFEVMKQGIRRLEDTKDELPEYEMTAAYLDPAAKYVFKYGWMYSTLIIFVWPLTTIAWGVFGKDNYTLWASLAFIWGCLGSIIIIILPIIESKDSIVKIFTCQKYVAPEDEEVEKPAVEMETAAATA